MKVLEIVGGAALETSDVLLAIMTSPYGSSRSRIEKQKGKIARVRDEIITELKEKQKLYNFIFNLKKDGLVIKKKKGSKEIWDTTKKGKEELVKLKVYYRENSLPEDRKYESEVSDELTIIAFDIPEKEKHKRDWLRRKLVEMKFKMLQGSVWVGKRKVPEDFLEDLNVCKLMECVEIFTVNKKGSLSRLSL